MATNTEKSELLTVYDENLNPVGERTRAEVHADGLLHRTIRLWTVQGGNIWFQQRSMDKALFPGRLDLSATGHVDPGESPDDAVLRETREEIGLGLSSSDLAHAGDIPFPFTRPDGRLDNEFASIYLYAPDEVPDFRTGDEVAGLATVALADYDALLRTGKPARATFWKRLSDQDTELSRIGWKPCGPDDFCCLNPDEWQLVREAMKERTRHRTAPGNRGLGNVAEIARRCREYQEDEDQYGY